jgi:hypothetical protein
VDRLASFVAFTWPGGPIGRATNVQVWLGPAFAHTDVMSKHSTFAQKLRFGALSLLVCTAGAATAVTSAQARNGADDGTTTTQPGAAHAPLISDIEVDYVGGQLRLRTEVASRGAKVTSVRIRYRGVSYKATRILGKRYGRTVAPRGGDRNDSVISLTVTACAGTRCSTKTGSDAA